MRGDQLRVVPPTILDADPFHESEEVLDLLIAREIELLKVEEGRIATLDTHAATIAVAAVSLVPLVTAGFWHILDLAPHLGLDAGKLSVAFSVLALCFSYAARLCPSAPRDKRVRKADERLGTLGRGAQRRQIKRAVLDTWESRRAAAETAVRKKRFRVRMAPSTRASPGSPIASPRWIGTSSASRRARTAARPEAPRSTGTSTC